MKPILLFIIASCFGCRQHNEAKYLSHAQKMDSLHNEMIRLIEHNRKVDSFQTCAYEFRKLADSFHILYLQHGMEKDWAMYNRFVDSFNLNRRHALDFFDKTDNPHPQ